MKILLVYPNDRMDGLISVGVSVLSAHLKAANHKVELYDTTYFDTGISSNDKQYFYKIQLFDGSLVGESSATSHWLTLSPQDNAIALSLESNTPWQDTAFVVFRKNPNATTYDSISYQIKYWGIIYRDHYNCDSL